MDFFTTRSDRFTGNSTFLYFPVHTRQRTIIIDVAPVPRPEATEDIQADSLFFGSQHPVFSAQKRGTGAYGHQFYPINGDGDGVLGNVYTGT